MYGYVANSHLNRFLRVDAEMATDPADWEFHVSLPRSQSSLNDGVVTIFCHLQAHGPLSAGELPANLIESRRAANRKVPSRAKIYGKKLLNRCTGERVKRP